MNRVMFFSFFQSHKANAVGRSQITHAQWVDEEIKDIAQRDL